MESLYATKPWLQIVLNNGNPKGISSCSSAAGDAAGWNAGQTMSAYKPWQLFPCDFLIVI